MKHYDGPAFYRSKKKLPKQTSFIHSYQSSKNNNTIEKTTEKNNSHIFHPSYVPPSLQSLTDHYRRQKYQDLIQDLQKTQSSYLLFTTENTTESDLIDLDQLEDSSTETITATVPESTKTVAPKKEMTTNVNQPEQKTTTAVENKLSVKNSDSSAALVDEQPKLPLVTSNQKADANTSEKTNQQMSSVETTGNYHQEKTAQTVKAVTKKADFEQIAAVDSAAATEKKILATTDKSAVQRENSKSKANLTATAAVAKEQPLAAKTQPTATNNLSTTTTADNSSKHAIEYHFPSLDLLPMPIDKNDDSMDEWVLKEIDVLNETLKSFRVQASVSDWTIGPTVTQFEVSLARGVKVSKITNLVDDLKLALAARDIRIEAPIPGKSTVGIEIPNLHSRPVMLKEVLQSSAFKTAASPLTVALGVDLFGQPRVMDLRKMPHGLIAGATGSGKSVFINSLLVSLLYKATPNQVKLLLIDPKTVEMAPYQGLPHLLAPVISDPTAASAALKWVVEEMEQRYQRLAAAGVRNLESYNQKAAAHGDYGLQLPYIVIVIDELADLMMVAAADVQDYIARITQKARAAGIHLLVATQRPSVDVVTGTIKNNIPTRIAFMVASQTDSRTILDTSGAERLLGKGDLLYLGNGSSQPLRLQGTYIGDEIDQVTDYLKEQQQPDYSFDPAGLKAQVQAQEREDELFPQVMAYLVNEETTSTSKLQRVFSIGYNRAAGLIDELEARGYISAARGSKPRQVFLKESDLENE
ncbi:MAG: DNA translocase FtsK [Liquorilactobacillus ghanensis]|uniref:DNA translocase FtsK n=1 Tax=Liquorilactobacillus ghanensis TaxID=399370 RepID=UPI0039EAD8D1